MVGYPGKEIDTGVCKHGKGRIAGSEGKGRGRAFHQSVGEPGSRYTLGLGLAAPAAVVRKNSHSLQICSDNTGEINTAQPRGTLHGNTP